MTTEDAIRFLDHQARLCRGRDASEAFCLLLPAMLRVLGLERMDDLEAAAFRHGFKQDLATMAHTSAGQVPISPHPARYTLTIHPYEKT